MAEPVRLLVASDSDEYLARILRELEMKGISAAAERVASGESIRAALGRGPWDAAVSDIGVPGLEVEEVVRLAREEGPGLPVIVVLERAGKEEADRALGAGAAEFIPMEKLPCAVCAVERVVREAEVQRERFAVEKGLREARELLGSVLSCSPVLVLAVDGEGVVTMYAGEGTRVAGREPGELVGRNVFDLYAARPALIDDFRRALAGERAGGRIRTLNGALFDGRFIPSRDESGKVTGAVVVAADVTGQTRAEGMFRERDHQLRTVVANAPVILFAADPEGTVTLFEGKGTEIFGLECPDMVGMNVFRDLAAKCPVLADSCRRALAGEDVSRLVRPETGVYLNSRCGPLRDERGEVAGVICVATDVSDRVHAEEALRESEARYRALVENTNDMVVSVAADGTVTYASPQVARLGLDPAGIVGRDMLEFIHAEDRERVAADFRRSVETGEEFPTEFRMRDAEGRVLWFEDIGKVQRDEEGRVAGLVGVLRDVTDRKRAEEEVQRAREELEHRVEERTAELHVMNDDLRREIEERRAAEERLRLAEASIDQSRDPTFWVRSDARFLRVNDAACEALGYSRDELLSMTIHDIDPLATRDIWPGHWAEFVEKGMLKFESVHRAKDGREFPVEVSVSRVEFDEQEMMFSYVHDVTERKEAEAALRESEERYRSFVQDFQGIAYRSSMDWLPTFFHGKVEEITGYTEEEFTSGTPLWNEVVRPDDLKVLIERDAGLRTVPGFSAAREYRILRKDGEVRWVRDIIQNVCDESGVPAYLEGTLTDVTERRLAEEALRLSEEKFRQFFENEPEYCYMVSPEGLFLDVNRAALEALGYARDEIIGRTLEVIYPPEALPRAREIFEKWRETGGVRDEEIVIATKAGGRRTVLLSAAAVRNGEGRIRHSVSVQRDITERKAAEEEIKSLARFPSENPNPVMRLDRDGTIIYANASSEEVLAEWGTSVGDHAPDRWRAVVAESMRNGTQKTEELPCCGRVYLAVIAPVADAGYANLYASDITELKVAADALRESEERFRRFFESSPDAMFIVDRGGVHLAANEAARRGSGRDMVGRSQHDLFPKETADRNLEHIRKAVGTGEAHRFADVPLLLADGLRYLDVTFAPMRDEKGDIVAVMGLARDVTDVKLATDALRASEERYALAQKAAELGSWDWDVRSDTVYWSPEMESIFGLGPGGFGGGYEGFLDRVHQEDREEVEKAIRDCLDCLCREYIVEHRIVRPDGEIRWLYGRGTLLADDRREPVRLIGVAMDITERKLGEESLREARDELERRVAERTAELAEANERLTLQVEERKAAEKAVRASEARYRALVSAEKPVVWTADAGIRFTTPQPAWEALTGQPWEEHEGLGYRKMFHPEDVGKIASELEGSGADEGIPPVEVRIWSAEQKGYRWFRVSGGPVLAADGSVREWAGMFVDIHVRRLVEEALAEAERRLREFVEGTDVLVTQVDGEGRLLYVNRASERIFGCTPENCVGRFAFDFVHPDDREATEAAFAGWLRDRVTGTSFENRQVSSSGEVSHVLWTINPRYDDAGDVTSVWSVARDITDRKRAAEALRESEFRFRTMFESAPDGMLVIDTETRSIVQANDAFCQKLGRGRDEVEESDMLDFAVPGRRADAQKKIDRVRHGEGALAKDVAFAASDGSVFYADMNTFWISLGGRRLLGGILRDITAHKEFEEMLRRSEEMYRSLVRSIPDGIAVAGPDGTIKYVSSLRAELHGYESADQLLGMDSADLVSADGRERFRATYHLAIQGRAPPIEEFVFLRGDGSVFAGEMTFGVVGAGLGKPDSVVMVLRDVTGRKDLERRLMESQRLEAVGRLAGGLAHGFNDLLTAIGGFSNRILKKLRPESPLRADAAQIRKASDMAASLTSQLLAFSRRQIMQPVVLTLNEVIADIETMLRRLIGEDVKLVMRQTPTPGLTLADPGQIGQVIVNLAVNARDAMPHGGVLTIETSDVEFGEERAAEHPGVPPGEYVTFSVSDTGAGIPPEVLPHIFEPFFTTKEQGKGTGLGLSTVYGIVTQSGGHVRVRSEVGRGSTFVVYLPRVGKSYEEEPATQGAAQESLRGTETVLLVEDEQVVKDLTRVTLADYGYRVLDASDGEEAISIAASHEGPIHLLLADVVMPQMSGREVAARIVASRPGTKVVFMSGYTDNVEVRGAGQGDAPLIAKPFSEENLALTVRRLLDSARERPAAD